MHVGKRYGLLQTVLWTKKYFIIFLFLDAIPVLLFYFLEWNWLVVPWQPISLIGIAVAFYLGFKNNSSYERLWEARKIWGGIVNASRSFTVMSRDFVTDNFAAEPVSEDELNKIRKRIVHRHVAWLHALTYQMREPRTWEHFELEHDNQLRRMGGIHPEENHIEKVKVYLSEEDYDYIISKGNRASHLLSLQSRDFKALHAAGLVDDFRHMEIQGMINEFYTLQGQSERIKNFPFPRQYATVNFYFVWLFSLLLPFAMLNVFSDFDFEHMIWMAIPLTALVSWVFFVMEAIGDYSENPFEGLYNDVPIRNIATGIEIDIRQMLDETDLPEPTKPIPDYDILL